MGMNLMNIMKTVQKAQSKAVEVQKELEDLEITLDMQHLPGCV